MRNRRTATSRRRERGYIWDYAARAGVTVRSYGEFVDNLSKSAGRRRRRDRVGARPEEPRRADASRPSISRSPISKRVDTWLQEFNGFVQNGNLPQLSILHLGNDHTLGTTPARRRRGR